MSALHIDLRLQRPGFTLQAALQLPPQGVTVLWGASGSGKTSLLRCVAGLERGAGRVQLGDTLWQDDAHGHFTPVWERRLGVVFQEASLFDHLDVQGNLHYGLRRLPAEEQGDARKALDEAVQVLGKLELQANRQYLFQGTLKPGPELPDQMKQGLPFLGQPDSQGRFPLRYQGRI